MGIKNLVAGLNHGKVSKWNKAKRKINSIVLKKTTGTFLQFWLYRSYWQYKFYPKKENTSFDTCYFTAIPNAGAGIGHQLANWIAGYWFANQFGLKFAHAPFSSKNWEDFFGFGINEPKASELIKSGYAKVRLPLFHEHNKSEIAIIKDIIQSYGNKKVVFIAAQDQYYKAQFGVIAAIKNKFYSAPARNSNKLIFNPGHYNVAIHVRRGDIVTDISNKIHNKSIRFQSNDYFITTLTNTLQQLNTHKPVFIYLFSQGDAKDFKDFEEFPNLSLCLEMGAMDSFNHMVHADVLITSRSSFSYKAALLNNGLKVCPANFWHGYPASDDFVLVDDDGEFKQKECTN